MAIAKMSRVRATELKSGDQIFINEGYWEVYKTERYTVYEKLKVKVVCDTLQSWGASFTFDEDEILTVVRGLKNVQVG